ncbi:protein of unknown function [Methylorubrum extorquens]|uniref:Uncharacterized protein n=1 Tax=Methylorubrum extorquens TaxID=408 RepID=A0A2N9ANV1_METEX|nr:protein of unknown function [Methylorubrum extorquens]
MRPSQNRPDGRFFASLAGHPLRRRGPRGAVGARAVALRLGGLHLQNLTAAVHAGLQVDVVRTAQFARVLVLDIGRGLEGVGGAAHAATGGGGLSLRNGHGSVPQAKRAPKASSCLRIADGTALSNGDSRRAV